MQGSRKESERRAQRLRLRRDFSPRRRGTFGPVAPGEADALPRRLHPRPTGSSERRLTGRAARREEGPHVDGQAEQPTPRPKGERGGGAQKRLSRCRVRGFPPFSSFGLRRWKGREGGGGGGGVPRPSRGEARLRVLPRSRGGSGPRPSKSPAREARRGRPRSPSPIAAAMDRLPRGPGKNGRHSPGHFQARESFRRLVWLVLAATGLLSLSPATSRVPRHQMAPLGDLPWGRAHSGTQEAAAAGGLSRLRAPPPV
ncbi:Hypothetical predicted protein [Podarcis lilfordi]|uniref:Uncharacterized protein n=1 Tax=Podarcis lilfordi TaxID=74358 RepID=A0AA35JUG7_9SAUR|nr:Hypothetical predicted protein [Podarcis lilfordi]